MSKQHLFQHALAADLAAGRTVYLLDPAAPLPNEWTTDMPPTAPPTRLRWVRLATGDWYDPEHHIEIGRSDMRNPIRILTPDERDLNFADGWSWRAVVNPDPYDTDGPWEFSNIPEAKRFVAAHLDLILAQATPGYDGDRIAYAQQRKESTDDFLARMPPSAPAPRRPRRPTPAAPAPDLLAEARDLIDLVEANHRTRPAALEITPDGEEHWYTLAHGHGPMDICAHPLCTQAAHLAKLLPAADS